MARLLCLLCLLTVVSAGCGGGGDGDGGERDDKSDDALTFSQSYVESAMTSVLRNAPGTRWRLDGPVECDDQGDAINWTCTAEAVVAEGADEGKRLTLTVVTVCGIDSVGKRGCTRVSTTESE